MKYNDEAYKGKLGYLLNDIFYAETSYDGKIARMRTYAEVILRRLLKWDTEKQLTLGSKIINDRLNKKKYTEPFFRDSLSRINNSGSGSTHTQMPQPISAKEEYERCVDDLYNLYAYLFYDFFKRYTFGTNNNIVSFFSILPPAIRHTSLNELYKIDQDNIVLVEHLASVKVKAFNLETALNWIEENKDHLTSLTVAVSQDYKEQLINKVGEEVAEFVISQLSTNMYDICKQKARDIAKIPKGALPYTNFEEALAFYKKIEPIKDETDDAKEFHNLMKFVYCGRKEKARPIESPVIIKNLVLHVDSEDSLLDKNKKEDCYHFTIPFKYIKKNYGNDIYDDAMANMEIDVKWDTVEHGYRITHYVPDMELIDPAEGNGSEDEFYENAVEPVLMERLLELGIDSLGLVGGSGQ